MTSRHNSPSDHSDDSSKGSEQGDISVLLGVVEIAATLGNGENLEFEVLFHFEVDASLVSLMREKVDCGKSPVDALGVQASTTLMKAMHNALFAGSIIGVATRFQPSRYARAALLDFGRIRAGREPLSDATVADAELLALSPVDVLAEHTHVPIHDGWFVIDGEFAHLKYRHFIPARDPEVVFHEVAKGGEIE